MGSSEKRRVALFVPDDIALSHKTIFFIFNLAEAVNFGAKVKSIPSRWGPGGTGGREGEEREEGEMGRGAHRAANL